MIGSQAEQVMPAAFRWTMGGILILCRVLCHSTPVAPASSCSPLAAAARSLARRLLMSWNTVQAMNSSRPT